MRKTQSLSITLPHDMAQLVKDKVADGAYATESEVIRDGLRALQQRDAAVEQWLRTEGVARYDAYHADPSRGIRRAACPRGKRGAIYSGT
jgi:putative addiction module CopG family antidote